MMKIRDERIDGGKAFDWGRTSADYARYRDIYPEIFYEKIAIGKNCNRRIYCKALCGDAGVKKKVMAANLNRK